MDITVWMMIFEAIMELFKKLQENKDEDTLLKRMARPRLHEARIINGGLYAKGLRGRQLRLATKAALDESASMTRDEHIAMLAMAKDWTPDTGEVPEED